jgi:hypothetical protein
LQMSESGSRPRATTPDFKHIELRKTEVTSLPSPFFWAIPRVTNAFISYLAEVSHRLFRRAQQH